MLVSAYRQQRLQTNALMQDLGLDEAPSVLFADGVSAVMSLHFWILVFVYLTLVAVAWKHIYRAKKTISELARQQLDRLHALAGLENEPYIVMKVH